MQIVRAQRGGMGCVLCMRERKPWYKSGSPLDGWKQFELDRNQEKRRQCATKTCVHFFFYLRSSGSEQERGLGNNIWYQSLVDPRRDRGARCVRGERDVTPCGRRARALTSGTAAAAARRGGRSVEVLRGRGGRSGDDRSPAWWRPA